jgi:L-alanine-DL-glutamate epimerase-like enolase superfamily enzyme
MTSVTLGLSIAGLREVWQALNVDVMAERARKTYIPPAMGERIFTKWGFREILEKRAAIGRRVDGGG